MQYRRAKKHFVDFKRSVNQLLNFSCHQKCKNIIFAHSWTHRVSTQQWHTVYVETGEIEILEIGGIQKTSIISGFLSYSWGENLHFIEIKNLKKTLIRYK